VYNAVHLAVSVIRDAHFLYKINKLTSGLSNSEKFKRFTKYTGFSLNFVKIAPSKHCPLVGR